MNPVDIWRHVAERIGFYTKETAGRIPDQPGIYGWFLPLWEYDHRIDETQRRVTALRLYDTDNLGACSRSVPVDFHWRSYDMELRGRGDSRALRPARLREWQDLQSDPEGAAAFSAALMQATIFTAPLYVGRADNLSVRYSQHVTGAMPEKNTFHRRFTEYASTENLGLQVSDLVFVCIPIDSPTEETLDSRGLTSLLEYFLMRLTQPPFSDR